MTDASVSNALRSQARLVVIEAPAGCGKTYQGAACANDIAATLANGRVLVLTHTHAACDVFAKRTRGMPGRVEIRTIDSLINEITAAYHRVLGLPADTATWARSNNGEGYAVLASKAANLLRASPMIAKTIAQRFPVLICDEHQDASSDQHSICMACYEAGATLRVFGDPMQRIYGRKKPDELEADHLRWTDLKRKADICDRLEVPHRWSNGSASLGQWILQARADLQAGGGIMLAGHLPPGVSCIQAENTSPRQRGYQLSSADAKRVRQIIDSSTQLLILASHNATVDALRPIFGRRVPIWEGHTRNALSTLVDSLRTSSGDAPRVTEAVVMFLDSVLTGFSPSAFSNRLLSEVRCRCTTRCRGKPATLQSFGRLILEEPNHKGVAKVLQQLHSTLQTDPAFKIVKVDYLREFWDAIHLGQFDDADSGLVEISRRRTHARPSPTARAISTVHKAKGLECDGVVIMPCDKAHFADTMTARCCLYVAMSRAMRSVTFVVSRRNSSPLLIL